MYVKLTSSVRHNHERYGPGVILKHLKDSEAQRLVRLGGAVFVDVVKETENQIAPDNEGQNTDDLRSDLNDFSYEELKQNAASIGLSFPGNISKEKLIDLVIESGKADEFFEDEED